MSLPRRIVIPAWRRGFFRGLGSVADWAVKLGIPAALWWRQESSPKHADEQVDGTELVSRWLSLDLIAFPEPRDVVLGLPGGPREATVLCDHAWDMLNAPRDGQIRRCYATNLQRRMHGGEGVVTGMPALDAVQKRDAEPAGAWAVYGPKWRVGAKWSRAWWRRLLSWPSFFRALSIIRQEAERAGVAVILQTRPKDRTPACVRRRFAVNPASGQLYPHPGLALLHAVDLVIHWQSGVVFEAAAVGVPQISLPVAHDYLADFPAATLLYDSRRYGPLSTPGVVQAVRVSPRPGWRGGLRAALRIPPDIEAPALAAYRQDFCGDLDGEAGRRVLEEARR